MFDAASTSSTSPLTQVDLKKKIVRQAEIICFYLEALLNLGLFRFPGWRDIIVEPLQPLLTIKDVVALTRLSKSKVYQLKDAGVLTPVRLPGCGKVLFEPSEVRRFLAAGRAAAPAR